MLISYVFLLFMYSETDRLNFKPVLVLSSSLLPISRHDRFKPLMIRNRKFLKLVIDSKDALVSIYLSKTCSFVSYQEKTFIG